MSANQKLHNHKDSIGLEYHHSPSSDKYISNKIESAFSIIFQEVFIIKNGILVLKDKYLRKDGCVKLMATL